MYGTENKNISLYDVYANSHFDEQKKRNRIYLKRDLFHPVYCDLYLTLDV